jgi:uncharacterized protein
MKAKILALLLFALPGLAAAQEQPTADDRRLRAALPGIDIGSVDLFQGQEAPVVIVSMCASSAEAAPRGLEFLLNRNRLNVALSRAQALAIVVGSPALAQGRAASVAQMKLLNLYCRMRASAVG